MFYKKQCEIQCICGCNEKLLKYDKSWRERKYIFGHYMRINHPMKGKLLTEEHKAKINPIGRKHSNKTKQKMSDVWTNQMKINQSIRYKGKKRDKKITQKISVAWTDKMKNDARKRRLKQIFPIKDTKLEIKFQQFLINKRIKFTKHKPITGQPDVFIKPNICIFVDGCYWHGCKKCGFINEQKNIYDRNINIKLEKDGYRVIRFWEHEINKDLNKWFEVIING